MHNRFSRSEWFRDARFGMFIHWGPYAVPARGEWVRSEERISVEDYQTYIDEFTGDNYDPEAWADLAVEAGMKYAILTAKHHDGFALFDSKHSDYTTMHNGMGRDVVAEFLAAFRSRGIRVGLYFSLLDWRHPDYPTYADSFHPMRGNPDYKDHQPDFDRYLDFMHAQVDELCSNYGELDILWFDFSYDDLRSEAWRAEELIKKVRAKQPNVIIDNRLEVSADSFGSIVTADPAPWSGDFVSPEQLIPAQGVLDFQGRPVPWESCITLNNHWAYCSTDSAYKSARMIIRKLAECVSKGGNLLLNVGPDASGRIPARSVEILREVGEWTNANSQSIVQAGYADMPKPEWGYYTANGNTVYAHVLEQPVGPLALTGIDPKRIRKIRTLADRSEVRLVQSWLTEAYPHTAFISFGEVAAFTYELPDTANTVLEITLDPLVDGA